MAVSHVEVAPTSTLEEGVFQVCAGNFDAHLEHACAPGVRGKSDRSTFAVRHHVEHMRAHFRRTCSVGARQVCA